ncbi:MAG TPA: DUF4241 domain-containing protein [Chloroflexia bacterium]|nr:DUF4241 domain-containing protein [Chloroflexia bacterium]
MELITPDLSRAFEDGRVVEVPIQEDTWRVRLERRELGHLVVASGKVVGCDPFTVYEGVLPFDVEVEPGRYPVVLSIAHVEENGDQRVAYAMLSLGEGRPVRWELATWPGRGLADLGEGEVFGYPVDAGTGSFMDEVAARMLAQDEDLVDRLLDDSRDNYVDTWTWTDFVADDDTGANVISFSSGFGDGFYPSYMAFDEDGRMVALVTDFGVVQD